MTTGSRNVFFLMANDQKNGKSTGKSEKRLVEKTARSSGDGGATVGEK